MKFKPSSIFIYIREDMETTCVHQHMNGLKHMVHRHNGILFDLKKKKISLLVTIWMDLEDSVK